MPDEHSSEWVSSGAYGLLLISWIVLFHCSYKSIPGTAKKQLFPHYQVSNIALTIQKKKEKKGMNFNTREHSLSSAVFKWT